MCSLLHSHLSHQCTLVQKVLRKRTDPTTPRTRGHVTPDRTEMLDAVGRTVLYTANETAAASLLVSVSHFFNVSQRTSYLRFNVQRDRGASHVYDRSFRTLICLSISVPFCLFSALSMDTSVGYHATSETSAAGTVMYSINSFFPHTPFFLLPLFLLDRKMNCYDRIAPSACSGSHENLDLKGSINCIIGVVVIWIIVIGNFSKTGDGWQQHFLGLCCACRSARMRDVKIDSETPYLFLLLLFLFLACSLLFVRAFDVTRFLPFFFFFV